MSSDDNPKSGLAWPDQDGGSTPPEDDRRLPDDQRKTRKPMSFWDRSKILIFLMGFWGIFVWAGMVENLYTLRQAVDHAAKSQGWLLFLALGEAIRQLHYRISETSPSYHRFWKGVFKGFDRRSGRMNDWNRFRIGRAIKWMLWFAVLDVILAKMLKTSPVLALFQLPIIVFRLLPIVLQIIVILTIAIGQFVAIFWFLSKGGVDVYFPDDIKTRFSDVWGQDSILVKVTENMLFLEDPESIEKKGGYVPGGILLWGPPGTGKTLMAEAVAGETGKPFVFVDPGAFINMFIGVGVLKVKSLFRRVRKLALRYGGVIVFFDEADSLGNRGALTQGGPWGGGGGMQNHFSAQPACNGLSYMSTESASLLLKSSMVQSAAGEPRRGHKSGMFVGGGMGGGGMGTLNALLTELSGLKKPRGFFNRTVRRLLGMRPKPPPKYRILVIMATNLPQALDEALLRPGRIDRIYKVGYPSKVGRVRTYDGYLAKVKHQLTAEEVDRLATITPYSTGATIKDMVNEALINAIREGRDTIHWKDIVKAKQLKDLGPPEDVEYIERERHAVAIHEACHAVVAQKVQRHLTIDIATIEKGGSYLGLVASIPPEDQFIRWKSEYEADLMVSLASLAGERMFFEGDSSSGVSGDLEGATQIATLMEGYWGMGRTVASHGVTHGVGIGGGGKPGKKGGKKEKDLLEGDLGHRIEATLGGILERTRALIEENRQAVLAVAHALETHKTVTGGDVEAIIDGREGPLIDGRPYHTPEFIERAEAYHSAVVSAHKSHARPSVMLPSISTRWVPSGQVASEIDLTNHPEDD